MNVARYISKCRCGRKKAIDLIGFDRKRYARDADQTEYLEHDAKAALEAIPESMRRCGCGRFPILVRVHGTLAPNVECNSQCSKACSEICACSCGGANHGAAYVIKRIERAVPIFQMKGGA